MQTVMKFTFAALKFLLAQIDFRVEYTYWMVYRFIMGYSKFTELNTAQAGNTGRETYRRIFLFLLFRMCPLSFINRTTPHLNKSYSGCKQ